MRRHIGILSLVTVVLLSAGIVFGQGVIELPKTGQTSCYNDTGSTVNCTGTGQDGELQLGAAWPVPRIFHDGDCFTDKLTGLTWIKSAFFLDSTSWSTAVSNANTYSLCSKSDWRLPNVHEVISLTNSDVSCTNLWLQTQGIPYPATNGWSSTTSPDNTTYAYNTEFCNMPISTLSKNDINGLQGWLVRGGQQNNPDTAYPANIPKTGQKTIYAPGDDGDLEMGVAWPNPRLTDNGNTVTDNLTGLVWSKEAKTPGPTACSPGVAKKWQAALDHVKCLNNNSYLGFRDWHLPNKNELRSLIDYSTSFLALPTGHPFTNVQNSGYWSSTTKVSYNNKGAWTVHMGTGTLSDLSGKPYANLYVWPVRMGPVGPSCMDADNDGYGNPGDASCDNGSTTDCNDNDIAINPGAQEICDEKDNDCNAQVDEGWPNWVGSIDIQPWNATSTTSPLVDLTVAITAQSGCASPGGWRLSNDGVNWTSWMSYSEWYPSWDLTNPAYGGNSSTGTKTVYAQYRDAKGNVSPAFTDSILYVINDADGDGVSADLDCDDDDKDRFPGNPEVCDGKDNDCDTLVDEGLSSDGDSDGHYAVGSCLAPNDDCADNDPDRFPGKPEVCDSKDNDCDTQVDEGLSTDADNDNHYAPGSCATPNDDCADNDQGRFPGNPEVCDGKDNDCDTQADEGLSTDGDGDGHYTSDSCMTPNDDCDDTDPALQTCNTPPSENPVEVTDGSGLVTVTFPNVQGGGDTTISVSGCSGGWDGIILPSQPLCADITTSATFLGLVKICLPYDDSDCRAQHPDNQPLQDLCELEMEVYNCDSKGVCQEIPVTDQDVVNNTICAVTDHFSVYFAGFPKDSDNDGRSDLSDNCPYVMNFGWADTDGDGVGNACDGCLDLIDPTNGCTLCSYDADEDGDEDGLDLGLACSDSGVVDYLSLAFDFGRDDCPVPFRPCSGELSYDVGISTWHVAVPQDWAIAVRFTPTSYPWTITRASFWPWQESESMDFEVHVWDDDGTGGLPGTDIITPIAHTATTTAGWEHVDLPATLITEGEFYIGWVQKKPMFFYNGSNNMFSYNGRSYARQPNGTWLNFSDLSTPREDNMMIRQECR